MNVRFAILISAVVHIAIVCAVENWVRSREGVVVEVAVSQGAPVVISAYVPPAENPFDVPYEPVLVEEVVEVSIEPAPELEVKHTPVPTDDVPPTDREAETVKVAAPTIDAPKTRMELPKIKPSADVTAAPLERKQVSERKIATPTPPVTKPPPRALASPPRVRSETITIAHRTPAPFSSSAPQGASVDQMPRQYRNNPAPLYPRDALTAGIEGRVLLRITIEADGSVGAMSVSRSSGSSSLDEAAMAAVRIWRFDPARRGGEAVAYDVLVPVSFGIRRS